MRHWLSTLRPPIDRLEQVRFLDRLPDGPALLQLHNLIEEDPEFDVDDIGSYWDIPWSPGISEALHDLVACLCLSGKPPKKGFDAVDTLMRLLHDKHMDCHVGISYDFEYVVWKN